MLTSILLIYNRRKHICVLFIYFYIARVDIIAIPGFAAGAMENWGLVMFRESDLLYAEGQASSDMAFISYVIAHELAHQVCPVLSISLPPSSPPRGIQNVLKIAASCSKVQPN